MALRKFSGQLDETSSLKKFTGELDSTSADMPAPSSYRLNFPGSALDGIEVQGRDMRDLDFKRDGRLPAPIPAPALRGSPGAVLTEAPPKPEPASLPRQITDAWLAASQQAAGVVKGIPDNLLAGDNPISSAMETAIRGLDRYKSADARQQIALRNMEISAAEKNGQEAAARAAFNTLFKYPAAGRDVVVGGAGSFAPTIGLSAAGAGLRSMAAFNAASNAGSVSADAGERLRELPDDVLAASKPYKMLRDMGLDHETAKAGAVVTLAAPSQITGGAVGYLAGRTGLEKGLASGGANTIRDRAGRAAAELIGEEAEELAPLFWANSAMRTLDGQTPYLQKFGRTAVDTLAGGSPAAALSAAMPARQAQTGAIPPGAIPPAAPQVSPNPGSSPLEPTPPLADNLPPQAGNLPPQVDNPPTPEADPVRALTDLIASTAVQASPLQAKATPQAELSDEDVFGDTTPSGADLLRDATKMMESPAELAPAAEMQQEIDAQLPAENAAQDPAQTEGTTEAEPRLPKELAGAKPRYAYGGKQFDLTFESDIDRAAYIAAQATPSARDADYVDFAVRATGQSAAEIRKHGAKVRAAIKSMAKDATPGMLTIPTQYKAPAAVDVKARRSVPKASNTLLQAIINRGGISRSIMQDVGGDPGGRYAPGLFTKNGTTDLSELAELLANEDGFAIDLASDIGGARELEDMVARMLGGERITNTATMEAERNKAEEGQYREQIRAKAKELGVRTVARKFADVEAEVRAVEEARHQVQMEEMTGQERMAYDALLEEASSLGIDVSDVVESIPDNYTFKQAVEAASSKLVPMIEQRLAELNSELQQATEERDPDEQSYRAAAEADAREQEQGAGNGGTQAGAGRNEAQGGSAPAAGFDLAGQSNEEIAAAEKAAKEAEAKRLADERAAEQRRQADAERGSFTLTGSDRPADVAAANGQNDLFSTAQSDGAGMSSADIEAGIKRLLGDDVGQALLDAGIISIDNTLPADVQGATYRDGRIVLNPKALDADTLAGVVQHEGFHSTIKELVGQATYDKLMARLQAMLDSGVEWAKDARAAVPSDTKPEHLLEEVGAYAIEQYANGAKQPTGVRAWVEAFLSAIRTALIRHAKGRVQAAAIERMQPQDLARLAIAGLKAKAAGMQSAERAAPAYSQDERDLIAQHNISARGLLHADRMGGLAVPSLAVAKRDAPLTGFGEITLLADKRMVDPKNGAKAFGADIYSPRYPSVEFKPTPLLVKRVNARLDPFRQEGESPIYGGDQLARPDELTSYKPFQRYVADKLGESDVNAVGYHDLKDQAAELMRALGAEERIFKGFTYSGNRSYTPHTLENVVKILKKELRGGEGYNYGVGSVRAKYTPKFNSLAKIKAEKGRLTDKENFAKVKEEVEKEFFTVLEGLAPYHPASDRFGFADTGTSMMSDAATMGIPRALEANGFNDVPVEVMADVRDYINKLRDLPTEYFEVKHLRDVGINEFAAAVVPDDVSEAVLAALRRNGIDAIHRYKSGDEASRKQTIAEATEDLRFSRSQTDTPAFRRWFGDSKVVDENGRPKVVYHGTVADIAKFEEAMRGANTGADSALNGFFFTDDSVTAESYANYAATDAKVAALLREAEQAEQAGDWDAYDQKVQEYEALDASFGDPMNRMGGQNVVPVYLSISNPLVLDANGENAAGFDIAAAVKRAIRGKHDGLIIENLDDAAGLYDRPATHYVAFQPEQIKSATGNNGDFDPANPDIRYSKRTPSNDRRRPAGDGDPQSELAMPKAPTPRPAMPSLGDVFRFERNPAGRGENVAGRKIYDRLASYATSYLGTETLGKFALADDRPEAFKTMMRQWRTDQRKAASTAKGIAEAGQKLTIAQRKAISALIEKQVAVGDMPPQEIVDLAASITASLEVQARELVELGMLTEDRLVENYLPRLYQNPTVAALENGDMLRATLRKTMMRMRGERMRQRGMTQDFKANQVEAAKKLGWKISREGLAPEQLEAIDQGRTDIKVPMWRDYTKKEREAMGEIDDAIMRYAVGFMETQKDVAIGRLFQSIASNADLAKNYNPGGWTRVPQTSVKGAEGLKAFGKLAGMWVHPSVALSLEQYTQPKGSVMAAHDKLLAMWKEGKVVWNPVSHGNNIASNVHTAVFAGLNITNPKLWRDTLREYKGKGEYFNEAVEAGLFGNSVVSSEIIDMLTPDLGSMKSVEGVISSRLGKLAKMAQTVGKPVGWYRKKMQTWYEAEDAIFKLMAFMESRKAGATPEQSVAYAERYFFNYNDMPPGIEMVKRTAIPFVSYAYRAAPMLVHTAMTRPDLMLLPAALYMGANMLGYAMSGGDEEEERKAMPDYMKGWSAATLTPKAIRLPFNMDDRPVFYDISRRVPMGDLFDVNNQLGGAPIPQPLMPGHPLLSLTVALLYNKDTFTGKELTKKSDTFGEALQARVGYTYRQVMPNAVFVPGSYSFNQALDGIASATGTDIDLLLAQYTGTTKSGDPVNPITAALSITGLAKVRSFDPEKQMDYKRSDFNREAREIMANKRSIMRDKSLTEERRADRLAEQQQKQDQLRERKNKELN